MNTPEKPSASAEAHLLPDEAALLRAQLPHDLKPTEMEETWDRYQAVIAHLLVRMGTENLMLDSIARMPWVLNLDAVWARFAMLPQLSQSAVHVLRRHRLGEMPYRLAGECSLMELSAAAGYRTFCMPDLIKGLLKTGKMKNKPVTRMLDTFEFLNTMFQQPLNDSRVVQHLARTNGLHATYKVAGHAYPGARDLFKYIALNMFYIGPMMRPDLTPQEKHAICGLTVLVSKKMGHAIEGSVNEFEAFIRDYEATQMFDRNDQGILRRRAVEIAQASKQALYNIPTVSPARIHGYVPYAVKQILEI